MTPQEMKQAFIDGLKEIEKNKKEEKKEEKREEERKKRFKESRNKMIGGIVGAGLGLAATEYMLDKAGETFQNGTNKINAPQGAMTSQPHRMDDHGKPMLPPTDQERIDNGEIVSRMPNYARMRICDIPASLPLEQLKDFGPNDAKCKTVPPGQSVNARLGTLDEYEIVSPDGKSVIGYAAKDAFDKPKSDEVAPGIPRFADIPNIKENDPTKIGIAFGTLYPLVDSNNTVREPVNHRAIVSDDKIQLKGQAVEVYQCDSKGSCFIGTKVPYYGLIKGITKIESISQMRDGKVGEVTGKNAPLASPRHMPTL